MDLVDIWEQSQFLLVFAATDTLAPARLFVDWSLLMKLCSE